MRPHASRAGFAGAPRAEVRQGDGPPLREIPAA
jgi:hypothetical protein